MPYGTRIIRRARAPAALRLARATRLFGAGRFMGKTRGEADGAEVRGNVGYSGSIHILSGKI